MKRLALMGPLSIVAAQVQLLYLLGASKSCCEEEGCGQIASRCTKLAAKEEVSRSLHCTKNKRPDNN